MLIAALTYSELKTVMADLDLRPERSTVRCRSSILEFSQGQRDRVRKTLDDRGFEEVWVVHSPPDQTWVEFQSWRQQIRGMAEAITDLSWGNLIPAQDRDALLLKHD
jgi:hypothetical protein